ncbi:MAG: hypothetical protein Q9179_002293 [Wetmoreana sp. 5 TL-2023]
MSSCCVSGFQWNGSPQGTEGKLGNLNAYIAESQQGSRDIAILFIADLFGWTLNNNRLLADHFAKEVDATVYVPDFYDGEVVSEETMNDPKTRDHFLQHEFGAWVQRNSKETRASAIHEAAKVLKEELGFRKVGAIGYCWGGWAVFQLGAKGKNLVDCISTAHPSLLTKEEIDNVGVPVQILAPEHDSQFTPELKEHANKTIPALNVAYDYQYFPALAHGFAARGDRNNKMQKEGLERAKNAASCWFASQLHLRD